MDGLFLLRERFQDLYAKNSRIFDKGLQLILAFATFYAKSLNPCQHDDPCQTCISDRRPDDGEYDMHACVMIFDKGLQLILAFATFYAINTNIGYMKMASSPVVSAALAIVCTFLSAGRSAQSLETA